MSPGLLPRSQRTQDYCRAAFPRFMAESFRISEPVGGKQMKELSQRDSGAHSWTFKPNRRWFAVAYGLSALMPFTACYSADLTSACKSANREASTLLAQERLQDAAASLSDLW